MVQRFRVSGPAEVGGESECTSLSSTFNTTTVVRPLSKAQNPQLLSGRRSINGTAPGVCSLLCVCALGWVKCKAQILSMGHHTWPHVTSL